MKLYLFLTNTIGGCSGGVTYVRNKLVWLQKRGWDVVVYDAGGQVSESVLFTELMRFLCNRNFELYYPPCFFTQRRRNAVVNRIANKHKYKSQVVVESNTINLALWGEMIASSLKAKHLIYLIQENLIIQTKEQFDYLNYKAKNKELFSINTQAYELLFSKYEEVKDADNHYWEASNASPILDIENERLNNIPRADINISHFGRKKDYFHYMINEVKSFAESHPKTQINFLLLGIESFKKNGYVFSDNLNIIPLGNMNPVPSLFYKISNVVIATAGCASMSFKYGAKVISMDTSECKPLGVMGFTTLDRTYRTVGNNNNKDLSVLLEELLIKDLYKGEPPMRLPAPQKSYDYQNSFATMPPSQYYNTTSVGAPKTLRDYRDWVMLRMGLVKLRTLLRYWAFRNSK